MFYMVVLGVHKLCPPAFFKVWILFSLSCLLFLPGVSQESFRLKYFPHRLHEVQDFGFLPPGLSADMISSVPSDERVKNHLVTIFPFQGTYYAFRECFFDVFVWRGDAWENLYPGTVHGYNCFSWQFIYKEHVYSLGRYGFYKMHSEVIQWSPRDRRWNILPVRDLPPNYSSSLLGLKGDNIISLFGVYLNETESLLEPELGGFLLDLKEKRWVPITIKSKILKEGTGDYSNSFDLDDYLVFKHGKEAISGYFILDKNTFEIFFWDRPNTMGSSPFFLVHGNKFVYQEITAGMVYVDFDEGRKEFEQVGKVKVNWNPRFPLKYLLLAIGLIGFIFALAFYVFQGKKNHAKNIENGLTEVDADSIEQVMDKLLMFSGQTLPVEGLDSVFGIDHLPNPDYKRVRRSRMIAEVNLRFKVLHGKDLIRRQRNKSDKRLVEYIIDGII